MSVAKLSVSLESSLARVVRGAAAEAGVSVSTWLAEAARAKARQRALVEALDDQARRRGALDAEERAALVADAREHSIVIRARKRRA